MSVYLFFNRLTFSTRGTVKTYSRQGVRIERGFEGERPRKRIRMSENGTVVEEKLGEYEDDESVQKPDREALASSADETVKQSLEATVTEALPSSSLSAPSSPPADRLFSSDPLQDEESELSSVPSSPPRPPSPKPAARKLAFSFLKRKRANFEDGFTSEPLSDITPNACKVPRLGKKALKQMQIDIGGELRKTCRTCGMEYIPSVREDSALHSKFCAMNVAGVEMGKAFLRDDTVKRIHSERTASSRREMVVTVNRKSSLAAKNRTRRVLEVVNAELSSTDIDDDRLWGALYPVEKVIGTRKGSNDKIDRRGDRFKAFLHMVDDRCVGFCLAEKISSAFPVINTTSGGESQLQVNCKSSSITTSTVADTALLGISRIWTSKSHRAQGIALDLLDCARVNFFYGVEAPKNLVAFSQPTESGGRLAERWFNAKINWHVYRGEQ